MDVAIRGISKMCFAIKQGKDRSPVPALAPVQEMTGDGDKPGKIYFAALGLVRKVDTEPKQVGAISLKFLETVILFNKGLSHG